MNTVFLFGFFIGVILSSMCTIIWREFKTFLDKVTEQRRLIKHLDEEITELKWKIQIDKEVIDLIKRHFNMED